MGRISGAKQIQEYVKKYSGTGIDFFSLKKDKDSAIVRFLHTDDQDLDLYLVHTVEENGRKILVECLEDGCPLCAKDKPTLKLFLLLYDYAQEKIRVWERGPGMIPDITAFVERMGYLNNRDYEVVRLGAPNDTKTKYQLFPRDKMPMHEGADPKKPEMELPDKTEIRKRLVKSWTAEQMSKFLAENPEPEAEARAANRQRTGARPGF